MCEHNLLAKGPFINDVRNDREGRVSFIFYVSTCRGEGGQKMQIFTYFEYILKYAYLGGEGPKILEMCLSNI